MKKLIILFSFLAVIGLTGCTYENGTQTTESKKQEEIQKKLIQAVPTPEISNSVARKNIAERARLFDAENKETYVYLISYGKVMAFYPVKGQVVSLRAYLTPMENIVNYRGTLCSEALISENTEPNCAGNGGYLVSAPDVDGTYGDTVDGIFFFTADTNAYVEWKGEYMLSDQPLKLATPPALIREIK
jgi:hypothetical protein